MNYTLRKAHFSSGRIYLMPDAVSSGHWAMLKTAVKNAAAFTSKETAIAALGIDNVSETDQQFSTFTLGGELHAWQATKFIYSHGKTYARIFKSDKIGEFAGIDVKILAIIGGEGELFTMYGASPDKPFVNAPTVADSIFIAMPFMIEPFPQEAKS